MLAQVGNTMYLLEGDHPLPVPAGSTVRVHFSFRYKVAAQVDIPVWASLYRYTLGIPNRVEAAQTKGYLPLTAASEWETSHAVIDVNVGSSVSPGVYGLAVELRGFDTEEWLDDCIEVTAVPGMMDMMGPLMMMGMMAVMVPMMSGMAGGMKKGENQEEQFA